jgi:hypothetical protein
MTIETRKKGDIISLKLVSGEEIIGYYVDEDEDLCTINKPFLIMMTPEGIAMAQWLKSLDLVLGEAIKINKTYIVSFWMSLEGMAKEYNSQMSSMME